jgi:hypothetical protein
MYTLYKYGICSYVSIFSWFNLIPVLNLHSPILEQLLMHLEALPQQMGFMAPTPLQALKFCSVKVILQYWLILGMCGLLDNYTSSFSGREAADIC